MRVKTIFQNLLFLVAIESLIEQKISFSEILCLHVGLQDIQLIHVNDY